MTASDGKGGIVEQCDRSDLVEDTRATKASTPKEIVKDKTGASRSRSQTQRGRSRKGKRRQRHDGQPIVIELETRTTIPARVLDESSSGMAIEVAANIAFRVGQRVVVRRNGVRVKAVVRNVESQADGSRVGLKLQQA